MARVLVGMSGGVDSSVAAAILAARGHEVIGVSLQLYDHSDGGRAARCCSPEDFLDARRVAGAIGFPYYVINREELFKRRVLDYFAAEYRRGRTPNPCARCNAEVKFEELVELARGLGASAVATGHYARVEADPVSGRRRLLRARHLEKDQSYFLFDLTQEHLAMSLFPLGEMTKDEVRAEAARLGLATAGKPESQDVCFVEGGDYRDFLSRKMAAEGIAEPEGEIVDMEGNPLGHHRGLSGFTVGQRRHLGVSAARRLYVVLVDAGENRVVLGGEEDLTCGSLTLSGASFMSFDEPRDSFEALVRVRYRHAGARAVVSRDGDGRATVRFGEPQRGVSPGQAAVFYDGEALLGGGWIDTVSPS
ncbi:MAG TPA: tRNA 2-thiouridine(34) synthase MnmA [Candidatus Polarisedimenticolia bacterium]|jgi:tRNA-specific 2-thiouridylase